MELLDQANTTTYGDLLYQQRYLLQLKKDHLLLLQVMILKDLQLLLEQTKDKGINIYTHGEMLPTTCISRTQEVLSSKGKLWYKAWQNQQKEFDNILWSNSCIQRTLSYACKTKLCRQSIYNRSCILSRNCTHRRRKGFLHQLLKKALALGGYTKDQHMTGINGGIQVTTGFSHGTVLSVADQVIEAVKNGDIKHFFLVGGCDGARVGKKLLHRVCKTVSCRQHYFDACMWKIQIQ
ncbi:MAG: hypothetical protein ACLR7D_03920 [Lachnospira eligens]